MKYTIDAAGKTLGRVASDAANALMGKRLISFSKNIDSGCAVAIVNANSIKITAKKKTEKIYQSYSGYPSGLKEITLGSLIQRFGVKEAVHRAVFGMLPRNTFRKARLKRLTVSE